MDILVKEAYVKKAEMLHQKYPVVDAHLDLAGEILIRNKAGETDIIKNYYLNHWKKAGINLIMSSIYVPTRVIEEKGIRGAWEDVREQIAALQKDMAQLPEVFLVRNQEELKKVSAKEGTGILLYMEGLDCVGEDMRLMEELYRLGVRGASLTWSRKNALANGCCKAGEYKQIPGGLTEAGKRAVKELERLSMFVDVSHLNDDGFEDVVEIAQKPFTATHSCARAVYDNYRNLTDEQMHRLAEKGGVMGLNGCKLIAGSRKGNHLTMLCRHAEYEVEKVGSSHVGFGFDLCDSYDRAAGQAAEPMDCFCDHSQISLLTAALLQRGMKEETVIQIMGENWIHFLKTVLPNT